MPIPLRALLVEDRVTDAELVVLELRRAGFAPEWERVETEVDFVASLRPELDVILSDYALPGFGGLRALELLNDRGLEIPFIIVSGTIGEETAVEAMRQGAADYLLKDRLGRLGPAISNAHAQGIMRQNRRKAEQTLRESSAFIEDILNSLVAEVVVMNERGVIMAANEAWKRFARENNGSDFLGQNYLEICVRSLGKPGEATAAAAADGIRSVLDGSRTDFAMEYPCHSPDEERWFQMRVSPLRGAQRGAVVVHELITERKRAEEALQLFRTLVDRSNDTFEVVDPTTGRFLDVNEKGRLELGYSREEYLALRVFDIDPAVRESDWPQVVERIRQHGSLSRAICRHRRDGSTFQAELNVNWVQLDRGYIVAVVRDITERQRTEGRIREQAAMLNQAREAIIVRDLHTRRITFWNQGAERLYGWTAAEAEGRHIDELIKVDPSIPIGVTAELLKTGEWRGEHAHVTKAGESRMVSGHATLVRDDEGNPKSALIINIDVTEQKELEARFLRAQRMESIGTLASGVAHDLNNILSPILLTAPMLRGELSSADREEIVSLVEISARRGAEIVKQVLTFGRGLEGERLPLQVADSIKEQISIMQETFPKNITLESAVAPGLWPVVGDATQIHQILLNLCVNARDAMPDGGRLRLGATNLELDAHYASMLPGAAPGPHVVMEVSDTGSGIPAEIVERIFEPFFTTKEIGNGTGLGLSTVLGIVKSHGGAMQVSSKTSVGSAFHIYLPASPDQAEAPALPSPDHPPRGHGELVLVVDDEASIRRAAGHVLERAGYRVLLASDGTEALAVFAVNAGEMAAVLTDLMMPLMDGIALIRAVRAMKPDLPIIAFTGLGEPAQAADLKRMKVSALLTKPFGAEVVLRTLREALQPEALSGP